MELAVKKGVDVAALKTRMLEWLESRGAQYPAEHNVGHLYEAKPAQVAFYRKLDPDQRDEPRHRQDDKTAQLADRQRMSVGLLGLLDDVAAIAKVAAASIDDVATQATKAGLKAAGAVIDDTAVTPNYVTGFSRRPRAADRRADRLGLDPEQAAVPAARRAGPQPLPPLG